MAHSPLPELRFAEIPAGIRPHFCGDRFCYMEAGPATAPALLLLHGIGANSLHWRFQFAGLADRFRVVAWNAPGYLLSDNFRDPAPGWRDWADAFEGFLGALGIGEFDLLANSFGTRVAQCFAAAYPGRIRCAVFTGASVPHGVPPEERERRIAARAAMIARGGYAFGERAPALLGSRASLETLDLVRSTLRATNSTGFMQAARFAPGRDMPPLGAGLTMPLLLIQGDEDRVTPAAANAELLLGAVPHARLVTIAGCGHLPEVEAPNRVNTLTRDFLAGGEGATAG